MSISTYILLALPIVWYNFAANAASHSPPEAELKLTPAFYKNCAETYGGDVVVSPFTAFSALTMFSTATNGNTYTQLVDGLGVQRNKAKVAKQMQNYRKDAKEDAGAAVLRIFNRIFVQKSYKLKTNFKNFATKRFGAGIKSLDFADAFPSAEKVNTFVEGKTNGTIQDVVRPNGDMFSADTRAVLLSGAYFHGEWDRPFDKQKSYWGSFNGLGVEYMSTQDVFNYVVLPELGATAVEIDYADSDISLVIVLPDRNLSALQNKLRTIDWLTITANMQRRYVNIDLPKFRSYFQFSLNSVMTNMNMGDMLTNQADLSGLLTPRGNLKVFETHHSTSIRLDEEASEIASGTSILPNTYVLADTPTCEPVVDFKANRPFLYYVRNKNDDSILFVGHLLSPITG